MPSFNSSYDQTCLDRRSSLRVVDWAHGDGPLNIAGQDGGFAAAIGNFEGVHLGHGKVISATVECARAEGLTPAVVTFDPHPRRFFKPDAEGFALADEEDKLCFLARLGVEVVIRLAFNDALRMTPAEEFVTEILPDLKIRHLFAGTDFAFGKGRSGSTEMIAEMGAKHDLCAHAIDLEAMADDKDGIISSSRIRAAITDGDMAEAARLLGRPYIISGAVIKGGQQGRAMGFPTANMELGEMMQPAFGVYSIAVRLADQGGEIYSGVANLGLRPMAENRGVLLEPNLFDYDGDLYGQRLNVFLLDFIRPEQVFESFDALKEQIALDVAVARQFHQGDAGILAKT
jgi:riboflavin kinase/FMN adenylyltransferase